MWVYNRSNKSYKLKYGTTALELKAKEINEISEELAMAFFGYNYGKDRDEKMPVTDIEYNYLKNKIIPQRWELNGYKITENFLDWNDPDTSVFFFGDNYKEMLELVDSLNKNKTKSA